MPNDIKLQSPEGSPVDENLRPILVGGKLTAIETAQYGALTGARVIGDLEITGAIKELAVDRINKTSSAGDLVIHTDNNKDIILGQNEIDPTPFL